MLKKAGTTPQFEDDNTKPAPAAAATTTAAPVAPAAAIAPPAAQLPVVAGSKLLPVATGKKHEDFFKQFANVIPAENLGYGTLSRLVGSNGAVCIRGNNTPDIDLGDWIEITLHSFHDEYVVSPGSDEPAAKVLVKYSKDNVTCDGSGENVLEYLKYLRETKNYPSAKSKRYVHLIATLEATHKPCAIVGDMVDVSVSPDGVGPWEGHRLQVSQKISQGKRTTEGAERVRITAVKKSGNGKNWVALIAGPSQIPVQQQQAA